MISRQNQASVYLTHNQIEESFEKKRISFSFSKFFVAAFASIFMILLAFQPLALSLSAQGLSSNSAISKVSQISGNSQNLKNSSDVNAAGALCGFDPVVGDGMGIYDKKSWNGWTNGMPDSSKGGSRTFTIQSGYGNAGMFVNYYGEGKGSNFIVSDAPTRPKAVSDVIGKADYKKLLDAERTATNCFVGSGFVLFSNLGMSFSNILLGISGSVTSMAINPKIICTDENTKLCIPLVDIIGGNGSDKGILGTLFDGIYFPLVILASAIVGIWVLWKGIAQRKFREAFTNAGKVVLVFFIAIALASNTAAAVAFPMKAVGAVTDCVVSAVSGKNCFDGSSTKSGKLKDNSSSSSNICNASGDSGGSMEYTVNNLNCQMWASFVLEPFAQAQFGKSFKDLDTKSGPVADIISEKKLKSPDSGDTIAGDTFCVPLSTGTAPDKMGNQLKLTEGSSQVCNLAAYQLMLGTNTDKDSSHFASAPKSKMQMDKRWYNIVALTASDPEGLWPSWGSSLGMGFFNYVGMSILASAVVAIIQIIIGATSLLYLLSSILLIVFAPVFMLLGFIPGRGMRIMFGWVEKIVSNILKYLISMVFLVVSIAILGAALAAIDNLFQALIILFLLGLALILYRGELVGLLGRANMGGEQLSSRMSDSLLGGAKRMKKAGSIAAGSAAGGLLAGEKNVFKSAGSGLGREMSRGQGFVANTLRQKQRISEANKSQLNDAVKEADEARNVAQENLKESEGKFGANEEAINAANDTVRQGNETIEGVNSQVTANRESIVKVIAELKKSGNHAAADYISARSEFENRAQDLNRMWDEARIYGTDEEIEKIEDQIRENDKALYSLDNYEGVSDQEKEQIAAGLDLVELRNSQWNTVSAEEFAQVREAVMSNAKAMKDRTGLLAEQEKLAHTMREQRDELGSQTAEYNTLSQAQNDYNGRKTLKASDVKDLRSKAKKNAERSKNLNLVHNGSSEEIEKLGIPVDEDGNLNRMALQNMIDDKKTKDEDRDFYQRLIDNDDDNRDIEKSLNRSKKQSDKNAGAWTEYGEHVIPKKDGRRRKEGKADERRRRSSPDARHSSDPRGRKLPEDVVDPAKQSSSNNESRRSSDNKADSPIPNDSPIDDSRRTSNESSSNSDNSRPLGRNKANKKSESNRSESRNDSGSQNSDSSRNKPFEDKSADKIIDEKPVSSESNRKEIKAEKPSQEEKRSNNFERKDEPRKKDNSRAQEVKSEPAPEPEQRRDEQRKSDSSQSKKDNKPKESEKREEPKKEGGILGLGGRRKKDKGNDSSRNSNSNERNSQRNNDKQNAREIVDESSNNSNAEKDVRLEQRDPISRETFKNNDMRRPSLRNPANTEDNSFEESLPEDSDNF